MQVVGVVALQASSVQVARMELGRCTQKAPLTYFVVAPKSSKELKKYHISFFLTQEIASSTFKYGNFLEESPHFYPFPCIFVMNKILIDKIK